MNFQLVFDISPAISAESMKIVYYVEYGNTVKSELFIQQLPEMNKFISAIRLNT